VRWASESSKSGSTVAAAEWLRVIDDVVPCPVADSDPTHVRRMRRET
jgi:hypothetical protein